MRRLVLMIVVLVLGAACSSSGDAGPPQLADPVSSARDLVTGFLETIKSGDSDALDEFLTEGYQVQRADGSGATKDEVLDNPVQVFEYEIGPTVVAVQDDELLTVRWTLAVVESLGGEEFATDERPRLSVFKWEQDRWRIAAHANFNAPN